MSSKKLNSLSDLAHIKFDKLAPDQPEPLFEEGHLAKVQTLECHFSKKGRAGKVVTLIKGFEGDQQALKDLSKILKQTVNAGGTVKNQEILIQGNYRDKIIEKLQEMGHKVIRIGG
jgi:translation initiation factor 1